MSHLATSTFQPLNIAILTVSDTRTLKPILPARPSPTRCWPPVIACTSGA